MSKHLLFHVRPQPQYERRQWQRKERNDHSLDARETQIPDALPRKGADDPSQFEWSSG